MNDTAITRRPVRAPVRSDIDTGDTDQVLSILTRAFAQDPPCRWMLPEPDAYRSAFPCPPIFPMLREPRSRGCTDAAPSRRDGIATASRSRDGGCGCD